MNSIKQLAMIAGLVFMAVNAATAARSNDLAGPPTQLYSLDKSALPPTSRPLLPDAAEGFLIRVDPMAVATNPATLLVDLPDYGLLEAVRTRFFDYQPDWKSWSGNLRYVGRDETAGSIHIGFHGDRITALIELDGGERYRIISGPEGQRLVRLSGGEKPCEMNMPSSFPEPLLVPPVSLQTTAVTTPPVVIDVLAVYAKEFFAQGVSSQDLETYLKDSIDLANLAFVNSNVNAMYRLVGTVPLLDSTPPATGLNTSLAWLTGDPNNLPNPVLPPAEITNLRTAFGADIVALYVHQAAANDSCGIANQPLAPNSNGDRFLRGKNVIPASLGNLAFSVHRYNCGLGDYTLAHEIGHNYGMGHHDDDPTSSLWLFPWGRGKVANFGGQTKATIMGCVCTTCVAGPSAVCNRIPYFSDPNILYPPPPAQGTPTGDPATANDPGRNNASVARQQVSSYAAFFPQSPNTPPNVSFTVSCSGLTCTFNANGTTDNTALQASKFFWYFGDSLPATPTTGKVVSHSYSAAGSYKVHLVVKDSGGQTAVKGNPANPWVPIYEGNHETTNCGTIHGWAWDKTLPNTPISVDIYRDSTKVATVPANLFGADLLSAGKGNGYHRFHYAPNSSWEDGWPHTVTVRYAGTNTYLSGTSQPIVCNASIFTQAPAEFPSTGGQVYSVATQFSSSQSGYITKLWFYRAPNESGTNTLHLTTDSGGELASVDTNCPGPGWCEGVISPVFITAGTRYRVWVNTNTYQSKTYCGIGSGITNGPLTAHAGYWIAGNTFPNINSCSNFFVDVSFYL